MSLGHGAKIVTNGLVFAYDMGPNPGVNKSWKGKPTTNLLLQSTREHTGGMGPYWNGVISVNNTEKGFPSFKITTTNNIRLDGFITSNGGNLTNGVTYTWSADVWAPIGKTVQLRIRNITGGSYRAGSAQNVVGSSSWVRVSKTFTADTNTAGMIEGNEQNSATDVYSFWVKNLQLEQQPFATPFVNGTRSNTEALLDWTGNNTITANSLTYNSDGSFEFGSSGSNYMSIPSTVLNGLTSWTIDFWLQRDTTNSIDSFLTCGSGNNFLWFFQASDNTLQHQNPGGSSVAFSVTNGVPFKFTATGSAGSISVYKNGVLVGTMSNTTTITVGSNIGIILGQEMDSQSGTFDVNQAFKGKIYSTKFYNKALTADEVKTNFNALRGRYGI